MESIRWEGHSNDLTSFVAKLYHNMEVTDCVLDTNGGLIKAHLVILAACSPYFKNLLMEYDPMVLIPLKEIKYTDMRNLLDFIYNGEVNVPVADVPSFMKTMKFFQVGSLFAENVSCNNTCKIHLSNSSMQSYKEVEDYTNHRIAGEDGSIMNYKNTELQTILKSSMIEKDIEEDGKNLPPFSFVAVPPFSEKFEEYDDESFVCSRSELRNPLEDYSFDSDLIKEGIVKRENDVKIEPKLHMCYKEEMNVCELPYPNKEDTSISQAQKKKSHKTLVLCDEFSRNMEGKSVIATQQSCGSKVNQNVALDKMVGICGSKDSFVERSTDMEVEFEAICDTSENDIKKEKFSGDLTSRSTLDLNNAFIVMTEPRGKQLPVDSTIVDAFKEVGDVTTSPSTTIEGPKVKNVFPKILLHSVNSSQVQVSIGNAVVQKSAFTQIENHEGRKHLIKRTGSQSSHIDSLNMKKRYNDQLLVPRDSSHLDPLELKGGHAPTENVETNSSNIKNYTCAYCRKSFDQQSHLTLHLQTHTLVILFPCNVCKEVFTRYDVLMMHMQTHSQERLFRCVICESSFTHKGLLEEHLHTHTKKKLFYCEICESSFDQDSLFKKHMQIHPGKETFQCEACEKSFAPDHLSEHKRTKEKPGLCEICQFSLSGNDALRKHMRTYRREKPFQCEICKKSFWDKSRLKDHMDKELFHCEIVL